MENTVVTAERGVSLAGGSLAPFGSVVNSDFGENPNRGAGSVEDAVVLGAAWNIAGAADNVKVGTEVSDFLAFSSLLGSSALTSITGSSAGFGTVGGAKGGAVVAGLDGTDDVGVTVGAGVGVVAGASHSRFFSVIVRAS